MARQMRMKKTINSSKKEFAMEQNSKQYETHTEIFSGEVPYSYSNGTTGLCPGTNHG